MGLIGPTIGNWARTIAPEDRDLFCSAETARDFEPLAELRRWLNATLVFARPLKSWTKKGVFALIHPADTRGVDSQMVGFSGGKASFSRSAV